MLAIALATVLSLALGILAGIAMTTRRKKEQESKQENKKLQYPPRIAYNEEDLLFPESPKALIYKANNFPAIVKAFSNDKGLF